MSNREVLDEVGYQTLYIPGGLLVSTFVCSCNDPSRHFADSSWTI